MESSEKPSVLPDIQKEAVEKFGTTNNPYDTGFILSDGRFLRRPKGTTFHNYVEGEGSKLGDYAYKFLGSGAIRFSRQRVKENDMVNAEFTQKPTDVQIEALLVAVAGATVLSIDFTDINTRRPMILAGKPVLINSS
ncbi:MAG: hypothetical protein Q8P25_04095, partial [Candidatus Curtissbacteria bacterium]|nr:hypothetical protein [Candidatus Curtissbacteria bacterium]